MKTEVKINENEKREERDWKHETRHGRDEEVRGIKGKRKGRNERIRGESRKRGREMKRVTGDENETEKAERKY